MWNSNETNIQFVNLHGKTPWVEENEPNLKPTILTMKHKGENIMMAGYFSSMGTGKVVRVDWSTMREDNLLEAAKDLSKTITLNKQFHVF